MGCNCISITVNRTQHDIKKKKMDYINDKKLMIYLFKLLVLHILMEIHLVFFFFSLVLFFSSYALRAEIEMDKVYLISYYICYFHLKRSILIKIIYLSLVLGMVCHFVSFSSPLTKSGWLIRFSFTFLFFCVNANTKNVNYRHWLNSNYSPTILSLRVSLRSSFHFRNPKHLYPIKLHV